MAVKKPVPTKKTKAKSSKQVKSEVDVSTGNLDDLMGQLSGTPNAKTKKKPAKQRIVLDNLSDESVELATEFCEMKTVFDLINKPFEQLKSEAKESIWESFCELWWDQKGQPQNPTIEIKGEDGKVDHQCMLILSERFSPQLDANPKEDGTAPSANELAQKAMELLEEMGLDSSRAKKFVENELSLNPVNGMHTFTRLSKGYKEGKVWVESSNEEKKVAQKILCWVLGQEQEPLTAEERALAIFVQPNISVEPGVLKRVHQYAKDVEELRAILAFLNPVYYLSKAQYAVNSTPQQRADRLIEVASNLFGVDGN